MNYLREIRETCEFVVNNSKDVTIDDNSIIKLVENDDTFPQDIQKSLSKIEWDSDGWHFNADASTSGPNTAQYILVLDALNFCFWPCPGFEYVDLATNLKKVMESNPEQFSSSFLSTITEVSNFSQQAYLA